MQSQVTASSGDVYTYTCNGEGQLHEVRDTTGTLVAEYDYDSWGKLLSATDANGNTITGASHIALRNPLRYRGYYYDSDTGFYYLQSRYYDPSIGRFINADSYAITGQGYLGCNMFAYCLNNPPNYFDADGCDAEAMATGWTAGMWWLTFADGILPIGDGGYYDNRI